MKKKVVIVTSALLIIGAVSYLLFAHPTLHPVIKSYGPVFDVPFAVEKTDSSMQYKIVVDCGVMTEKPIEKPGEIYAPLQQAARMYNLHVYGGVQQKNLDVAVVIWGDPISVVANNETYRKIHGVDNPNIKIISEMKAAGIRFYACGQSIKKFGIDPAAVNPDVTVAISRFTTVSTLQLKGYAYFRY